MPINDYDKPAEIALIEVCRVGSTLQISNVRPTEGNHENTIRAGLIRELLLGTEDCKLPAKGMDIQGAWIVEKLDLEGEAVPVPLGLLNCTLTEDVNLRDCTLPGLYLTGNQLPALRAQRMRYRSSLHLRHGFEARGRVDLAGAKIAQQLNCTGGKFWAKPTALNSGDMNVGASLLLSDGYEARGEVELIRPEIAGNLKMPGAKLVKGLIASGMRVPVAFFWRGVQGDVIIVELIDAHVDTLCDQPGSWDPVKKLRLSSFRCDRIESDMDVQDRLDWLAIHDATVSRFTTAHYVQLANVLRRQGFAGDAAWILIRREDKQRAAEWDAAMKGIDGTLRRELIASAHQYRPFLSPPFKWMFGYGHQPARVLPWIAMIWAGTFWFIEQTHSRGQFAPTSAVVLNSPEWLRSFPNTPVPADSPPWREQLDAWVNTEPGRDYESFSAWLYALDLFIPLDALGQEKNWAPSASRGAWGKWGHRLPWLVQMTGWVVTAMGAAVYTGLIGRRD